MHATFCSENLKGRGQPEDIGVHGKVILEWNLDKSDARVWIEFIWLRIGSSGGLL
jgi:hypothetical protein